MTIAVIPPNDQSNFVTPGPGALTKLLEMQGKMPPVALIITPMNAPGETERTQQYLDRFLTYQFNSSVTVPVDAFSFTYAAPDSPPIYNAIKVGDLVTLLANNQNISVGIIDQVEIEHGESGERITLTGRNLMGQLEDQECVNPQSQMIYAEAATLSTVMNFLLPNTRIQQYFGSTSLILGVNPPSNAYNFATEPGESKLAALQRYLEPLNCIAWMSPSGQIKIGKPNMNTAPLSTLYVNKTQQDSNVLEMKVTYNGTQIPGSIIPMQVETEAQQNTLAPQQAIANKAITPSRLWSTGHRTTKVVVVSYPRSGDVSEFPVINSLQVSQQQATQYPKPLLQTYALRELARQNMGELEVSCTLPGHYDENAVPFLPDNCYRIFNDRASVDETMYLYDATYNLDESVGQRSTLRFCRLNTIVSSQVAR